MNDDILKDITTRVVGTWPNTYTFTKAIAEDLLLKERCDVPTAIFRPSIVTCSVKEPFSVSKVDRFHIELTLILNYVSLWKLVTVRIYDK